MSLEKYFVTFGQAYGADTYGTQSYACEPGVTACETQDVGAPNTGFFATPDAAVSTAAGALLVTLALVGAVTVIISRIKHAKKQK